MYFSFRALCPVCTLLGGVKPAASMPELCLRRLCSHDQERNDGRFFFTHGNSPMKVYEITEQYALLVRARPATPQ